MHVIAADGTQEDGAPLGEYMIDLFGTVLSYELDGEKCYVAHEDNIFRDKIICRSTQQRYSN